MAEELVCQPKALQAFCLRMLWGLMLSVLLSIYIHPEAFAMRSTAHSPTTEPFTSAPTASVIARATATPIDVLGSDVFGSVDGSIRPLSIAETEDLKFLSHDNIWTWEGLVEDIGKPSDRVHLIDTERFSGHFGYTKDALGRGAAYTQTNFFNEVQSPETRRYMPFLVFDFRNRPLIWQGKSYRWVMNIRRYNYTDSHEALATMLVQLKDLLRERLLPEAGEPLLFVYEKPGSFRRPHINNLSAVQQAGFTAITEQAMIEAAGGSLVSVLNPGTAIGYLKRIAAEDTTAGLTPRHIAIFEETPEQIPPVTGIVTLEPQTPLSHINLLAKNRGTPNVSTARIELVPNLARLTGQLVRMVATADGNITITAATVPEAESFWAQQASSALEVPAITATSLRPIQFEGAAPTDIALSNIGSKASNYATIQALLQPRFPQPAVRPGFALSFAHYQKITAEPATQGLIQNLLANKGTLSPEDINTQLAAIRDSIRKDTSKETMADSVEAVREVIDQMPDVPRIRLRSSTNAEDLPTFNGAGLYESTGFNVEDSNKKLRKKLLTVMASLWLERAFWERELFGIDHREVGMAVLINPAFSDEYGNGVVIGSQESSGFRTWVNAQKGEAAVTNPEADEISESFTVIGRQNKDLQVQSRSNIGAIFLEDNADALRETLLPQLSQLQQITQQLYDYFVAKQRALGDHRKYGIDIEYKLMEENGQVALYVKQSRLLNLDAEAAEPNNSITKAIAKDNGMEGAHLRRQPKQLSELGPNEFCVVKTDSVVGINRFEPLDNGFVRINITIPSSSCPEFTGTVYVFAKHFNFI